MDTAHGYDSRDTTAATALPSLRDGSDLQIELLREPGERLLRSLLFVFSGIVFVVYGVVLVTDPRVGGTVALVAAMYVLLLWLVHKLAWAYVEGNSVEVGPGQFPQVYEVVRDAAQQLAVTMPKIFVMQGSGLVELLVAKYFTRRGYVIATAALMDALIESGTSRELMMLVGRQLGHIKAGHFKLWVLKDLIGRFTFLLHKAYWRRCHLTADRIGLMVAGDLYAAEQSLLILTVGPKLAAHTNMEQLDEQCERLRDGGWTRFGRLFNEYPYIVERISRLRQYAATVQLLRHQSGNRPAVGALPIRHLRLRVLPVMMVHGHDQVALLELKDFLRSRYPYVEPVVMSLEMLGAASLPEKFERLAANACGAIAILTPDDMAAAAREAAAVASPRARQNVVLEIGWFWGRLGRGRCLLLSHGRVEIPSDLAGVECLEYVRSPREHFESVRDFISQLERLESGSPRPHAATENARARHYNGSDGRAAGDGALPPRARTEPPASAASVAFCPECGAVLTDDSRFCDECGAPMAAAAGAYRSH